MLRVLGTRHNLAAFSQARNIQARWRSLPTQIYSGTDIYRILDLPPDGSRLPTPTLEIGHPKGNYCLDIYLDRDQILDSLGPVRICYEAGGVTPKLLFAGDQRVLIALDDRVQEVDFAARSVLRQIRVDLFVVGMALYDRGLLVIGDIEVVAVNRQRELWRTAVRDRVMTYTIANGRLILKLEEESFETLNLANGAVVHA